MRQLISAIRSSSGVRQASDRATRLIRRERTRLLANGLNRLAVSSIATSATAPFVAAFLGVSQSVSAGLFAAAAMLRITSQLCAKAARNRSHQVRRRSRPAQGHLP